MSKYNFNIGGFFSLIPTILRKARLISLLTVLLRPLEYLHGLFIQFKDKIQNHWKYSGQVFSLQKAIREYCDNKECYITDGEYLKEFFVPYNNDERLANYQAEVPYDGTVEPQVNVLYAGFSQIEQSDFIVYLPAILKNEIDEVGLRTLIDSYKIAGKFYKIVYKENLEL